MNEIKKILHEYLCDDAIILCELTEKAGDFVWLEEQGYYKRQTGEKTNKWAVFVKNHNKLFEKHDTKLAEKSFEHNNMKQLEKALRNYIKKNPDVNIYKGLTESEIFALRNILKTF